MLSRQTKRLLNEFESCVRAHEMRGYAMPESFAEIDGNYQRARDALAAYITGLEKRAIEALTDPEAATQDPRVEGGLH